MTCYVPGVGNRPSRTHANKNVKVEFDFVFSNLLFFMGPFSHLLPFFSPLVHLWESPQSWSFQVGHCTLTFHSNVEFQESGGETIFFFLASSNHTTQIAVISEAYTLKSD